MMRAVRALASLLAAARRLSGCALPFYWQAIGGQLELLRKRTPIEKLLADPKVDPKLKATLACSCEDSAVRGHELGLPDNESYTTYVELDRPYVVWNVVAADEFSVEPKRWCFPFDGLRRLSRLLRAGRRERFEAELARRARHLQRRLKRLLDARLFCRSRAEHDDRRWRAVCCEPAVSRARAPEALHQGRQ